jgi:hypothetical protein
MSRQAACPGERNDESRVRRRKKNEHIRAHIDKADAAARGAVQDSLEALVPR